MATKIDGRSFLEKLPFSGKFEYYFHPVLKEWRAFPSNIKTPISRFKFIENLKNVQELGFQKLTSTQRQADINGKIIEFEKTQKLQGRGVFYPYDTHFAIIKIMGVFVAVMSTISIITSKL